MIKILTLVAGCLFVLCLPLLLLSASIGGAVNSLFLYRYGFDKYDVVKTTGLSDVELDNAVEGLINYFNSGEKTINLTVMKDGQPFTLFNEREVIHLKDVKGLFRLDYWVFLGTLVHALAYTGFSIWQKAWRRLALGLVWGGGFTLGLMLLLGIGALLNFDQLFLQFHLLSFTNEFWQLDPSSDYLIMLFPRGFWLDATIFVAITTAIGAVVLEGLGIFTLRKAAAGDI